MNSNYIVVGLTVSIASINLKKSSQLKLVSGLWTDLQDMSVGGMK